MSIPWDATASVGADEVVDGFHVTIEKANVEAERAALLYFVAPLPLWRAQNMRASRLAEAELAFPLAALRFHALLKRPGPWSRERSAEVPVKFRS
jgi:hypothetical protein